MKRGFGLAELLAVLMLMGVVLLGAAFLARDLGHFYRRESLETRRRGAAIAALEQVARLARGSRIVFPASPSATVESRLELQLVDPRTARYPDLPLPESVPSGWRPDQPRRNLVIALEGDQLVLVEGARRNVLAEEVSGFGVALTALTRLDLSLSWPKKETLEQIHWTTFLPLGAP